MWKVLHEELASESARENSHGREAVSMRLDQLRVAVRAIGRINAPFSQTHRRQTVPLLDLPSVVCAERSPSAAHETTLTAKTNASAATVDRKHLQCLSWSSVT